MKKYVWKGEGIVNFPDSQGNIISLRKGEKFQTEENFFIPNLEIDDEEMTKRTNE